MNDMRAVWDEMVNASLEKLYANDIHLIRHEPYDLSRGSDGHVSERGIVARFAIYLQELLNENRELKQYHLDVEYNRNMDKPKMLPDTAWKNNGAYPDLIIHKRGCNDDNLLIVEFKTYWNNSDSAIEADVTKLKAFMKDPYFYKNALFVMLNQDKAIPIWIEERIIIDAIFQCLRTQKGGDGNE